MRIHAQFKEIPFTSSPVPETWGDHEASRAKNDVRAICFHSVSPNHFETTFPYRRYTKSGRQVKIPKSHKRVDSDHIIQFIWQQIRKFTWPRQERLPQEIRWVTTMSSCNQNKTHHIDPTYKMASSAAKSIQFQCYFVLFRHIVLFRSGWNASRNLLPTLGVCINEGIKPHR